MEDLGEVMQDIDEGLNMEDIDEQFIQMLMQAQQQEQCKPEICENKSSMFISRVIDDRQPMEGCDYCKSANLTRSEDEKSDEKYFMGGFTSGKFRIDDFEHALDMGACRSGDFIYFRNQRTSCCEVWNYRVPIEQFSPSKYQKKAVRRFQRFLQQGSTPSQKQKEQQWISQQRIGSLKRICEQIKNAINADIETDNQEMTIKVILKSEPELN